MRHYLEYPDGTGEVIDDGGDDEAPIIPVGTFLCSDGTGNHRWDQISGGVRCTACQLGWTME